MLHNCKIISHTELNLALRDKQEPMPIDCQSQRHRIIAWLRERPLSTFEARRFLDSPHPAMRIKELKDEGNHIVTEWTIESTSSDKAHHRIAKYVLLASV